MHLIDNSSAVPAMPALGPVGTPGWFTPGDPAAAQDSTIIDSDWANAVQAEIVAVLTAAGLAPDKTKLNQLATAIQGLISAKFGSPFVAVGSITLDATYAGKLVTPTAAGAQTITLPLANSVANGAQISFIQQQGAPGDIVTIAAQGTDKIMSVGYWNASAMPLGELGKVITLASDGAGHWYNLSNPNAAPTTPVNGIAANTTLDASYVGRVVVSGAANLTVTLPSTASVPNGSRITFLCESAPFTIATQGGQTIYAAVSWGSPTYTLGYVGEAVTLVCDGGNWLVVEDARFDGLGSPGQSFVNVGASRGVGSVYTNSTGRPIYAYIVCAVGGGQTLEFYLNGNNVSSYANVGTTTTSIAGDHLIPSGCTYEVGGSGGSINSWWEVR